MPESRLPTEDEIRALPRWARVAFAARCARRAQPYFQQSWPEAQEEHLAAIERAISVGESAAAAAHASVAHAVAAHAAARAVNDQALVVEASSASVAASSAATAAAHAAGLAATAAQAILDGRTDTPGAAYAVAVTVTLVARAANARAADNIVRDFQLMIEKSRREGWTDSTPVPPGVFGPLDAPPNPPPTIRTAPAKLELKCYLRPSSDPDAVGDKLVELYESLNDYSIEKYGKGLTIDEFEQFVNAGVLQPIGGGDAP